MTRILRAGEILRFPMGTGNGLAKHYCRYVSDRETRGCPLSV